MGLSKFFKNKSNTKEESKLITFKNEFDQFNSLDIRKRLENSWDDRYPCLDDKTSYTPFDAHYIYHPAWAGRILKETAPTKHIDISSTLHFCTLLSAFIPVEFYDYRPAQLNLSNLKSDKADLTNLFFETNSVESISCMHTIEHIGLGRYGDPIEPEGDIKAINELKRVTAVNGDILFVVPVGKPRIQFNAHRIYGFEQIETYFNGFELRNFSLVLDNQDFIFNADPALVAQQSYGCGCFWYKKK
jgi:hypothetical protein